MFKMSIVISPIALFLIWVSGLVAGRAVGAAYASTNVWAVYAGVAFIAFVGCLFSIRILRPPDAVRPEKIAPQ